MDYSFLIWKSLNSLGEIIDEDEINTMPHFSILSFYFQLLKKEAPLSAS